MLDAQVKHPEIGANRHVHQPEQTHEVLQPLPTPKTGNRIPPAPHHSRPTKPDLQTVPCHQPRKKNRMTIINKIEHPDMRWPVLIEPLRDEPGIVIRQARSFLILPAAVWAELADVVDDILDPPTTTKPEVVRPSQWRPGTIASNAGEQP